MKLPEGVHNPGNKVCKLKKSLYVLMQASRQRFSRLASELKLKGFVQSKNDYCLFLKSPNNSMTVAAIYVDDIILTGDNNDEIRHLKAHLHDFF